MEKSLVSSFRKHKGELKHTVEPIDVLDQRMIEDVFEGDCG